MAVVAVIALIASLAPPVAAQTDPLPDKERVSVGSGEPGPVTEGVLPSTANRRIAWDSDRDGSDTEIWIMDPDGGNKVKLTSNLCEDRNPAWSPDGLWLAYESNAGYVPAGGGGEIGCQGDFEIWVVDSHGGNSHPLTDNSWYDGNPSWSPDGSHIVFDTDRNGGSEVYWMRANGTEQTRQTLGGSNYLDRRADWSPDGSQLLFQSLRTIGSGNMWQVEMIDVAVAQPSLVISLEIASSSSLHYEHPDWSPDGERIAMTRRCPQCETAGATFDSIITVDRTGGNPVTLTNDNWDDYGPEWSPDGRMIVFESERYAGGAHPDDTDIMVMSASSGSIGGITNLTWEDNANDSNPDWGPGNYGDQDGDALLDLWEINGLWGWNCYRQYAIQCPDPSPLEFVDLPAMGADPLQKDLFVEVDHMTGIAHDPYPDPCAMGEVVEAFDEHGVRLHLDWGSGAPLFLGGGPNDWCRIPAGTPLWGDLSESDEIPHQSILASRSCGQDVNWATDFDTIAQFSGARRKIFRYAMFIDRYPAVVTDHGCDFSSGLARGIPAGDFFVSLGSWPVRGGTRQEQAGTFMHELGHTIGLQHGGNDGDQMKPNYRSVMNYLFQLPGIPGTGLDYSDVKLPDLNEAWLVEADGVGVPWFEGTRYYCGDTQILDSHADAVDWNCNNNDTEIVPNTDINHDGSVGVLSGFDDWDHLQFAGGGVGGAGLAPDPPVYADLPSIELDVTSYLAQIEDVGWMGRYAGPNRYATSAQITSSDFTNPGAVDTVFIATGLNYPDALAGAALAGAIGAPLLLVNGTSIPGPVSMELSRLDPNTIVVLGGSDVVSDGVKTGLGVYAPSVIRLQGANRYATAVEISKYGYPNPALVDTVFVATGLDFPDALAGASAAGALGAPLLLVRQGDIPGAVAQELGRLSPDTIVVLGGSDVVSDGVKSGLGAYAPSVIRLQGANRYATAVEISKYGFPGGAERVYVATGLNFPDALAGAAAAGWLGSPVLLVSGTTLPGPVWTEVNRLGAKFVIILGQTDVVSYPIEEALGHIIGL